MAPVMMSCSDELAEEQNDEKYFQDGTEQDDVSCACQELSDKEENISVNECFISEAFPEKGQDSGVEETEKEIDIAAAPDGGWGWFIVVGALLLRTVLGGLGRSHGLFYLKFKERFHGTATSTALVTSLAGFLRLSAGPVVSILSGRFRCRVLTTVGTAVLFLGLILTGFSPNLEFLYFSYGVISGIGRAFTLSPVPILLGFYFNKRRSLAFGLASAGFSIGGFAITPIVELLFQNYGYEGTFLILSGFALNIFVASALFRPIELHRKLTRLQRKPRELDDKLDRNSLIFKSLEHIESGTVFGCSTVSINRLHVKSSESDVSSTADQSKSHVSSTETERSRVNTTEIERPRVNSTETERLRVNSTETKRSRVNSTETERSCVNQTETERSRVNSTERTRVDSFKTESMKHMHSSTAKAETNLLQEKATHATDEKSKGATNMCNSLNEGNTTNLTKGNHPKDTCVVEVKEENEQKESLLSTSENSECVDKRGRGIKFKLSCCCRRTNRNENENNVINKKRKSKLISWSVLKDTRFQCYVFATFCFTLPSSALFLPALAKSKGVSDIQAATLLSISAGFDTVFRVISGIILDLKAFRSVRPQVYNGVTFLQGIITALFPLMTSYSEFMVLSAIDGAVQGTKLAQGTVIMLDMLGVDKLASCLAVTMAAQCIAIVLGPTISGQLSDKYGSYNGAFFFGSGAILLGGVVMAAGNIAKHCRDRKSPSPNIETGSIES